MRCQLELVRTATDIIGTTAVSIGIPWLGAWAVRKTLVQQRRETMIEVTLSTGYNAERNPGPVGNEAFQKAAAVGILAYAKGQAQDVLTAKNMMDDAIVKAGLSRLSKLSGRLISPAGPVPLATAAGAPA